MQKIIQRIRLISISILPVVILSGIIIWFFYDFFHPQLNLIITPDFKRSDLWHGYYPVKLFLSRTLHEGQLPLWTKDIASGYPLHADGQVGALMVLNLLFFGIIPVELALIFSFLFSFFLLGFGTYLFGRSLGLSRQASIFGALVMTFSGFSIMQITHLSLLQAASFMPIAMFITEKILQGKNNFRNTLLLALILSQQIFCGHQQITLYTLTSIILYVALRLFLNKEKNHSKGRFQTIVFIVSGIIFGLILSSALIFPSYELNKHSVRSQGATLLDDYIYPLKHLLTFLDPFYFGSPKNGSYPAPNTNWGIFWENTGYVGILPLILLFYSLFYFKKNNVRIFILLLTLSILLILGKSSPLYQLFFIPPFSFFRVPSRFLILTDFSIAIIAAIMLDKILRKITNHKQIYILFSFTIFVVQLITISYYYKNYHLYVNQKIVFQTPRTAEYIKDHQDNSRFVAIEDSSKWSQLFFSNGWHSPNEYLSFSNGLLAHQNVLFQLPRADSIPALPTKRMQFSLQHYYEDLDKSRGQSVIEFSVQTLNMFNLQSVKHILAPNNVDLPQYKKSFHSEDYSIYENPTSLPRARVAYEYEMAESVEDFYKKLANVQDLDKTVFLEENIPLKTEHNNLQSATIKWLDNDNTRITLQVKTENDGILVLADSYYPGWKAYIDGKQTKIYPANINQRAVIIEKGNHTVSFIYEPESFKKGSFISMTSYGLSIIVLAFLFVRPKSTKR